MLERAGARHVPLSFSGALLTGGQHYRQGPLCGSGCGCSWVLVEMLGEAIEEGIPPLNVEPALRDGLEQLTNTECPAKSLSHGLSIPRIRLAPQGFQKVPKDPEEEKKTRSSQSERPRNQPLTP